MANPAHRAGPSAAVSSRTGDPKSPGRAPISSQHLIFSLGGELFGVATLRVREIISYHNVTSVPMMPAHMRGVINLRGRVVPVIDLHARFGRANTEISRRTCIVILEAHSNDEIHLLGVIVDTVTAVRHIDPGQVEPAPSFGSGVRADFIEGMAKVNGKFVVLLNLAQVLSVGELAYMQSRTELQAA